MSNYDPTNGRVSSSEDMVKGWLSSAWNGTKDAGNWIWNAADKNPRLAQGATLILGAVVALAAGGVAKNWLSNLFGIKNPIANNVIGLLAIGAAFYGAMKLSDHIANKGADTRAAKYEENKRDMQERNKQDYLGLRAKQEDRGLTRQDQPEPPGKPTATRVEDSKQVPGMPGLTAG